MRDQTAQIAIRRRSPACRWFATRCAQQRVRRRWSEAGSQTMGVDPCNLDGAERRGGASATSMRLSSVRHCGTPDRPAPSASGQVRCLRHPRWAGASAPRHRLRALPAPATGPPCAIACTDAGDGRSAMLQPDRRARQPGEALPADGARARPALTLCLPGPRWAVDHAADTTLEGGQPMSRQNVEE